MSRPQQITVVGAGLVGSLLAVMLGRRGYRVTVLEKRPDMRAERISAGRSINLALAERGIHALRVAGLMDQVRQLLVPMRGRMLHRMDGRLEMLPYGQRPGELIYSVPRGELNKLMMSAAEATRDVQIRFLQECEKVDLKRGELTVRDTQTGQLSSHLFDQVIGADGANSAVREAIIQHCGGRCDVDMLNHDYKELTIPAGPGGAFRMEREALHIWPRGEYMLIALPNLDGSYTVTLFLPSTGEPSFASLTDGAAVERFFQRQFPDARPLIPHLLDDFFEHPTGELGTVRCWPWVVENRALIMGDAAHAIVPFHGQGMNAGFEDCAELDRMLEQYGDDWSEIWTEFPRQRKPNSDAIAQMALENFIVMRESVREVNFQLKKELGFVLERNFPDRFVPRYSMVMFHRVPYAEALRRGRIQDGILNQLTEGIQRAEQADWKLAEQLVLSQLDAIEMN